MQSKIEIIELLKKEQVRFVSPQFTDLLGMVIKNALPRAILWPRTILWPRARMSPCRFTAFSATAW
ncbi:MAG: hypothetical protein NTV33_04065, partial [Coprothermobacterota bacterium]|nr:hypothetical protein [Coprothermobacterota bacterium]